MASSRRLLRLPFLRNYNAQSTRDPTSWVFECGRRPRVHEPTNIGDSQRHPVFVLDPINLTDSLLSQESLLACARSPRIASHPTVLLFYSLST